MIHKAYGVGIIFYLIFYILTISYNKKLRKTITSKDFKLIWLFGMSMFITEKIGKRYLNNNVKLDRAINKLNVKGKSEKKKKIYVAEKISFGLAVIFLSLALGFVATEKIDGSSSRVETLKRDKFISKEYDLEVDNGGTKKNIKITAAKKELSNDEIDKILDHTEKNIKKMIKGKNKSLDNVCYNLKLIDRTKDGVSMFWTSSEPKILEHSGILNKGAKNGTLVKLTVQMKLHDKVRDYSFTIRAKEPKQKTNIEDSIQKYVDNNDIYSKKVELPKNIEGQNLAYYKRSNKEGKYLFIIGVILAIVLFIARDKDLYDKVKERNKEMTKDYPDIVSEYILYIGAGLSFKSATQRIISDYNERLKKKGVKPRYAYEELDVMNNKMKTGISESNAIEEFGERCKLHCYTKFCNILQQNLKRGTSQLSKALKKELVYAMENKKNEALKEGGEISTKLLGPMVAMLLITIVIVMVPAFLTMKISS